MWERKEKNVWNRQLSFSWQQIQCGEIFILFLLLLWKCVYSYSCCCCCCCCYLLHFVSFKNRLSSICKWCWIWTRADWSITYCHSNNERNSTRARETEREKLLEEIEKLPDLFFLSPKNSLNRLQIFNHLRIWSESYRVPSNAFRWKMKKGKRKRTHHSSPKKSNLIITRKGRWWRRRSRRRKEQILHKNELSVQTNR